MTRIFILAIFLLGALTTGGSFAQANGGYNNTFSSNDRVSFHQLPADSGHEHIKSSGVSDCVVIDSQFSCLVEDSEEAPYLVEVSTNSGSPYFVNEGPLIVESLDVDAGSNICFNGLSQFSVCVEGGSQGQVFVHRYFNNGQSVGFFTVPRPTLTSEPDLVVEFTETSMEIIWDGNRLGEVGNDAVQNTKPFSISIFKDSAVSIAVVEIDDLRVGPNEPPVTRPVQINFDHVFKLTGGCGDTFGPAEFQLRVSINREEQVIDLPSGDDLLLNVEIRNEISVATADIEIGLWERDGAGIYEQCDINPDSALKEVFVTYDVVEEKVISGTTYDPFTDTLGTNSAGTSGDAAGMCYAVSSGEYVAFCGISVEQLALRDHNGDGILDLVKGVKAVVRVAPPIVSGVDLNTPVDMSVFIGNVNVASVTRPLGELLQPDQLFLFIPRVIGEHQVRLVARPQELNFVSRPSQTMSVMEVDPQSNLLELVVALIPSDGITDERRKALLGKIAAFKKQLAKGAINGACNKLQKDIRKHTARWVSDYLVISQLDFTKADILQLVDDMYDQIGCSAKEKGKKQKKTKNK